MQSQRVLLSRSLVLTFSLVIAALAGTLANKGMRVLTGASDQSATTHRQPRLLVTKKSLDFGEVWENEKFVWTVRITNPGADDVYIDDFRSNCVCTAIEPRGMLIPGGEAKDLRLTLDLTNAGSPLTSRAVRPVEVSVAPIYRGTENDRSDWWTVRGKVRKPLDEVVTKIDFGRSSVLTQPLHSRKHTYRTETPLARLEASEPTGRFHVAVTAVDESGTRFDIEVKPLKPFAVGTMDCEVALRPVAREGQGLPTRRLSVRGQIVPDIQASPPILVLGVHGIGTVAEDTFTLSSLTGHRFRVRRVSADGLGVTAEASNSGGSVASHCVEVTARIEREGETKGSIRVVAVSDEGHEQEVVVPVGYHGLRQASGPR